jgi:hypothetical protein
MHVRDDLLDAQAAVDWAIAQMDSLQRRLIAWREQPPYRCIAETHPETGKKTVRIRDLKFPSPLINAEVGAIVNSLRSSLDILITSVAARSHAIAPEKAYFPIATSYDDWMRGKHKRRKVIEALPLPDRELIESLQPWRGGNDLLFALHNLDNIRKHRRLIGVTVKPSLGMISVEGLGQHLHFEWIQGRFEEDAVVAIAGADANHSKIELLLEVTISETGAVKGQPVVAALNDFASLAKAIISLFDVP